MSMCSFALFTQWCFVALLWLWLWAANSLRLVLARTHCRLEFLLLMLLVCVRAAPLASFKAVKLTLLLLFLLSCAQVGYQNHRAKNGRPIHGGSSEACSR